MGAICLAILIGWPYLPGVCKKIPPSLIAVLAGIAMVSGLKLQVNTIGDLYEISNKLPALSLPAFRFETIHSVLEKTPPELAADIADRGIVLTGGGSLLRGLEELISAKTGINTMTAEDPMTAVAVGTGRYVEFLSGYNER